MHIFKYSEQLHEITWFTFRHDVTRLLDRGNFFNPENSFAVFYDQTYTLFPFPVL